MLHPRHLLGSLLLGLVLGGCATTPGPVGALAPAPHAPPIGTKITGPTPLLGSPAIPPHLAGTPSFTVADAQQYVMTHKLPFGMPDGARPAIARAQFLISRDAAVIIDEPTGFADDHPLCVVELRGNFSVHGPKNYVATFPRAILIFDATTGNLVIGGGMADGPPSGGPTPRG